MAEWIHGFDGDGLFGVFDDSFGDLVCFGGIHANEGCKFGQNLLLDGLLDDLFLQLILVDLLHEEHMFLCVLLVFVGVVESAYRTERHHFSDVVAG